MGSEQSMQSSKILWNFTERRGHYLSPEWELKRQYYAPSQKLYPTICLSQFFFTPPKENSKTRLHLCLNMVYVFTLPLQSKIILLPHLTQLIFFSYPTILSSVPTPVMKNDRSLSSTAFPCNSVDNTTERS